ncbi:uridine kinase [Trichophyton violaceum]|uniref:Uridine kinase n=1 Tax=Trichophyton violaceum TaxID=34388 RepID=A0A178FJV3_TRIVO|nr:uridine kinase [Trichophyton violaceum]
MLESEFRHFTMSRQNTRYHCPWEPMIIVGVAGSSGSGKSSVSQEIINLLDLPGASILVMDSFYKTLTPEENAIAHADEYDFDSPLAIDFDVLVKLLRDLKKGLKVDIPIYSFKKHQREPETTPMHPPRVLILEGILAFTDPRILELLDLKIFVEADMDVCLGRRNIIIPRGIENKIAIDLVVKHIQRGLAKQASYYNMRDKKPSIDRRLSF